MVMQGITYSINRHVKLYSLGDHISLDDVLLIEKKIKDSKKHMTGVTGTDVIDFLGIESSPKDRLSIASCIRRNVSTVSINYAQGKLMQNTF